MEPSCSPPETSKSGDEDPNPSPNKDRRRQIAVALQSPEPPPSQVGQIGARKGPVEQVAEGEKTFAAAVAPGGRRQVAAALQSPEPLPSPSQLEHVRARTPPVEQVAEEETFAAAVVPGGRRWRRRVGSKSPENAPFLPGAEVEVRVDDDGFYGSWFQATVVAFSPARGRRFPARYTVTYSHLLAADGGGLLSEHFAPSHIRPRPPPPPPSSFRLHDIVEAFHKDGWWSGIVIVAPADPDSTVTVAFPITREVISFPPHLVRPRRDYVAGEWVPSRAVVAVQPGRAVRLYEVGDKVEVVRDREVFKSSWFPATVAKVVDPLSYIVEYFDQEVERDAGKEKATEYLQWSFIRPAVQRVPRKSGFQLRAGAAVEAYCDGAWSPGIVSRVVGDGEYEVSVDGKMAAVLVTKVAELLKPQYKWNGKQWRIVSVKRQANSTRRTMAGSSPTTPIDVASSGDEHSHDHESSAIKKSRRATKKPRKEPQQQELILTTLGAELRNKMDLAPINSASQQTQERLPLVKAPKMKKYISKSGKERTRSIEELMGKHDISANSRLIKNSNLSHKEVICALTAPVDCQAGSTLDKQVTSQTRCDYKRSAIRKRSKRLCSPHSSLDVDNNFQQHSGRENSMRSISCTQLDRDRSLEDTCLPLTLVGFESMCNAEGNYIGDNLLDEELTNGICQANRNGRVSIDRDDIQVAKCSKPMDAPILYLDGPIQQSRENYLNAGSSHSTVGNSELRRSSIPSNVTSPISVHLVPFVKTSPAWPLVEALDVFKLVPQRPHFLPLREYSLELREGMAFGLTVAFATLVENIRKASIEESMEFFEDKINTCSHLEGNGFNVQFLQSRLTKVLQIKSNYSEYLREINKLEAEMLGKTTSLSRMNALIHQKYKAIDELQQQLAHLHQEVKQIEKDRENGNAQLSRLKSKHSRIQEACGEGERKFRNILDDLRP